MVAELLDCLIRPYADQLNSGGGRAYLRIVAQLRGRFAAWRVESDVETTRNLASILDELETVPAGSELLKAERVVAMIMLMTATSAERARRIDDGADPGLPHAEFVGNLVDMCSALLSVRGQRPDNRTQTDLAQGWPGTKVT